MKEIGVVTSVSKCNAVVKIAKQAACEKCNICGFKKGDKFVELELINKVGAKLNDVVEVDLLNNNVLKTSAIVYGIPLVLGTVGIGLGMLFKGTELVQLLSAFGGIVLGFLIIRSISKHMTDKNSPKIIRVIEKVK